MDAAALTGRTALVTGASRGIGAATARALDAAGARVALTARSPEALHLVAATMANDPVVIVADLAEGDAVAGLAERALDVLGSVDVLVNNAAVASRLDTVDTDAVLIDELLAVNVRAPLLLIAALIPSMTAGGRARSSTCRRYRLSSARPAARPTRPPKEPSTPPPAHWPSSSAPAASESTRLPRARSTRPCGSATAPSRG